MFLGPGNEAVASLALWIMHASGGIGLDQLRLERPTEQAAHGIEEVACLVRCCCAAILTGEDSGRGDLGIRLLSRRLDHALEDVITLPPCGCGERSPIGRLTVAGKQPCKCAERWRRLASRRSATQSGAILLIEFRRSEFGIDPDA